MRRRTFMTGSLALAAETRLGRSPAYLHAVVFSASRCTPAYDRSYPPVRS